MNDFLVMLVLGFVEGLTEFLPISSTGHLIITSAFMDIDDPKYNSINIIIQLGAILAVVWHYRIRLINMVIDSNNRKLFISLLIAFLPVLILGPLLHEKIHVLLFNPITVAIALMVGGFLIFISEYYVNKNNNEKTNIQTQDELLQIKPSTALAIGIFQTLAMIPGTSRSAATIIGGLFAGLSRKAATEFSFLLALPTLGGAFCFELFQSYHLFTNQNDWILLLFGLVVSFVVALITIRWLLSYIQTHTFNIFAWYRILLGIIVLGIFL